MNSFSDNLLEFYERISSWENEVVKESRLSLPQMHTLSVIGSSGPLRMKELADKLGIVMGTLTVMIDRLAGMNMVKREANKNDKRSFLITLTKKGDNVYKEHEKHHHTFAAEISSSISDTELNAFNKTLEKILKNM